MRFQKHMRSHQNPAYNTGQAQEFSDFVFLWQKNPSSGK